MAGSHTSLCSNSPSRLRRNWVYPALFMVVLIGILAYFDVHVSARVLGVALICEVVALALLTSPCSETSEAAATTSSWPRSIR